MQEQAPGTRHAANEFGLIIIPAAGPSPTRVRLLDGTGILGCDIDGGVALALRSTDAQLSGDLEPPFADFADVGLHAGTGKVLPASVDAAADAVDVLGLRFGLAKGRADLVLEPRRLADKMMSSSSRVPTASMRRESKSVSEV